MATQPESTEAENPKTEAVPSEVVELTQTVKYLVAQVSEIGQQLKQHVETAAGNPETEPTPTSGTAQGAQVNGTSGVNKVPDDKPDDELSVGEYIDRWFGRRKKNFQELAEETNLTVAEVVDVLRQLGYDLPNGA